MGIAVWLECDRCGEVEEYTPPLGQLTGQDGLRIHRAGWRVEHGLLLGPRCMKGLKAELKAARKGYLGGDGGGA